MKKLFTLLTLAFCLNGWAQIVANFSVSTTNGCAPMIVNFTDNSTGSPTAWSWDFGNGQTSNLQNPGTIYVNAGVYSVTLTVSNSTFTNTVVKTNYISVNATPSASFTATPVCLGDITTFSVTETNGSIYNWKFGDAAGGTSSQESPTYSYTAAGTFPVTLIVTAVGGCSVTAIGNAVVYVAPIAAFTVTPVCLGTASFFDATASTPTVGADYRWNFGGTGTTNTATVTTETFNYTYPTAGTFPVTLIVDVGSCSSTFTSNAVVNPAPIPPVLSGGVTNPLVECQGVTPSTFSVTASAGITPVWYIGGTYIAAGSTYSPPTSLNGTTVYTVYDSSGVSGCTSLGAGNALTLTVTVNPTPSLNITASAVAICTGSSTTLTATGATTYSWSPPISLSSTTGNQVIANPTTTTIYTVNGSVGACASIPITVTVIVNPTPTISIAPLGSNSVICSGASVVLTPTSTPPGATTYTINPGGLVNVTSYTVSPASSITYTIDGTNFATGCTNTPANAAVATIVVYPAPTATFTLIQDPAPHTWDAYPTYAADVASATWYWGDGTSTTALYPSHTYSAAGTYSICVVATNSTGCVADFCQSDSVFRLANNSAYSSMVYLNVKQGAAGIQQVTGINSQVTVYPNPATTSLQVSLSSNSEGSTILITDIIGNTVKQVSGINKQVSISVADLNEGIYNVSISSGVGIINKRVVIVR